MNSGLGDQSGPIRNHLARLRTTAGKSRDGGRSCKDERSDLLAKPLNGLVVLPSYSYPQNDLIRITSLRRERPVRRVVSQILRSHLLELEAEIGNAHPEDCIRLLRFFQRLRPGVSQGGNRGISVEIRHRNLVEIGCRFPLDTMHLHPVRAFLFQLWRRELSAL